MTVLAGDFLRPARSSATVARHWRGLDLSDVAAVVAAAAKLPGRLLPYTRIDGRPAFPVVRVDKEVVRWRLSSRLGPVLDRSVLRKHAASGFVDAPPEAVVLSGFVTVEPFAVARRHLVGLGTWAPTVAALPAWRRLDSFTATQCDFYGHRVYRCDGWSASALPAGAATGPPGVGRPDVWSRFRNEQLFQLGLATGAVEG